MQCPYENLLPKNRRGRLGSDPCAPHPVEGVITQQEDHFSTFISSVCYYYIAVLYAVHEGYPPVHGPRTTAPLGPLIRLQNGSGAAAPLAALCLLLATLTLAARCYANTALVQFTPRPTPPINRYSNSLVLSPSQNVQSDNSVASNQTGVGFVGGARNTSSRVLHDRKKPWPMPSAHDHGNNSLSENGALVLVVALVVLTVALGLVTCVLSHYRGGGRAANPQDAAQTPTTAPMLSVVSAGATAGVGGMDRLRGRGSARELAASRDRQVRLHAIQTDIAINLPPSISLPDGEEHPFNSRLHIRDTEQESEIYQKCIRPPPNRTVLESESPPPYRSSSAGLLGSTTACGYGSDWSSSGGCGAVGPLVVRCHSMSSSSTSSSSSSTSSSTTKRPVDATGQKTDFLQKTVKIFTGKKSQQPSAPTLPPPTPVVVVPSRTRRTTPAATTPTTEQSRPSRPNV